MSSNASAASMVPPLKRMKVEHISERPSIRERADVMVDAADAGKGEGSAILAAVSAGAVVQNAVALSRWGKRVATISSE